MTTRAALCPVSLDEQVQARLASISTTTSLYHNGTIFDSKLLEESNSNNFVNPLKIGQILETVKNYETDNNSPRRVNDCDKIDLDTKINSDNENFLLKQQKPSMSLKILQEMV